MEKRFAVLIDGDNNSKNYIKTVMDEITNEGVITYKRMYGDWTGTNMSSMKETILQYSITPMQQYSYTKGKNATDSAMIIDAMDILYTGKVDGFCLVSSDSDFTKLAQRLREAGMIVIGMGKTQTPKSFVTACTKFKFIDLLNKDVAKETKKDGKPAKETKKDTKSAKPEKPAKEEKTQRSKSSSSSKAKIQVEKPVSPVEKPEQPEPSDSAETNSATPIEEVKAAIVKIIEERSDDDGWILLSLLGNLLQNKCSDFDCRNYGYKKTVDFLEGNGFEIRRDRDENNKKNPGGSLVYVGLKRPTDNK